MPKERKPYKMSRPFKIEVVPYDPKWPELFQELRSEIMSILGPNCLEVLHIGSTSIEGLSAKPIIDLIPVVKNIYDVERLPLEEAGFVWRGELGMLFRRFVIRYEPDGNAHVHIWEQGSSEIEKHLLFADYLRHHPETLKAYEDLKLQLARSNPNDMMSYIFGKDALVKDILKKAGFNGRLIVEALTGPEKEAYVRMLGLPASQFSDPNKLGSLEYDKHLVLIQGVNIVGAAHLGKEDQTYKIKALAIDDNHRDQGLEENFRNQLIRWTSAC